MGTEDLLLDRRVEGSSKYDNLAHRKIARLYALPLLCSVETQSPILSHRSEVPSFS